MPRRLDKSRAGFVYDVQYLNHQWKNHPECAERLAVIIEHLKKTDLWQRLLQIQPRVADEEELAWVHSEEHLKNLRLFCKYGGGWFDADTYALSSSYDVARLACGGVLVGRPRPSNRHW